MTKLHYPVTAGGLTIYFRGWKKTHISNPVTIASRPHVLPVIMEKFYCSSEWVCRSAKHRTALLDLQRSRPAS